MCDSKRFLLPRFVVTHPGLLGGFLTFVLLLTIANVPVLLRLVTQAGLKVHIWTSCLVISRTELMYRCDAKGFVRLKFHCFLYFVRVRAAAHCRDQSAEPLWFNVLRESYSPVPRSTTLVDFDEVPWSKESFPRVLAAGDADALDRHLGWSPWRL